MTKKELCFTGLGFGLWFVNINVMGRDILPDFLGIIFLGYVLYGRSKKEKIHWPLIPLLFILCLDRVCDLYVPGHDYKKLQGKGSEDRRGNSYLQDRLCGIDGF